MSAATQYAHPAITVSDGVVHTCEVLNLTRNVRLEGTSSGRSHVWISSTVPQTISFISSRYMGPRRFDPTTGFTVPVVGRYGLHWHMNGDASRGTVVTGAVVRDGGNHAFVPHMSNGITLQDCISHNTFEDAFWYDPSSSQTDILMSNDLVWDRCVASLVYMYGSSSGPRP